MAEKLEDDGPRIRAGERLSLTGRSGSGKTTVGRWFMARSGIKWIVIDTKHDPAFDARGGRDGLLTADQIHKRFSDGESMVVVRPTPQQNEPKIMDGYLMMLHEAFENVGINVDEAYQCTNGPYPGPGLKGLLTRGRVRKQAVIVGTQTPSWVPKFCFSEANYFASLTLTLPEHRERIRQFVGDDRVLGEIPERSWWWYDVRKNKLERYGAVTLTEGK